MIAADGKGETLRVPGVRALTCQSTLRIPSGQKVTLAGMGREAAPEKKRVVLVTAEVVKGGEEKKDEG